MDEREWLTDRFLRDLERELSSEEPFGIYRANPERLQALRDLRTRQTLLLVGLGGGWAALLTAAFLKFGRAPKVRIESHFTNTR